MIDWILGDLKARVADAFSGVFDYLFLGEWYGIAIAVLAVAVLVRLFVPFKWLESLTGVAVLGMGAFVAGMQIMFNRMRADSKVQREKLAQLQKEQSKTSNQGGWFW